jgi:hypothetical protein
VSYDASRVTALIKELLSLNRAERVPLADLASAEQLEDWKSERLRIRQELVQVVSRRGLPRELLVMQNYIKQ